jgi:hypothetical protein
MALLAHYITDQTGTSIQSPWTALTRVCILRRMLSKLGRIVWLVMPLVAACGTKPASSGEVWKWYSSNDGRFAVLTNRMPEYLKTDSEGTVTHRFRVVWNDKDECAIYYADLGPNEHISDPQRYFDANDDWAVGYVSKELAKLGEQVAPPRIVGRSRIEFAGLPASEASIDFGAGRYKAKSILSGRRSYVVRCNRYESEPDRANATLFMNSFCVLVDGGYKCSPPMDGPAPGSSSWDTKPGGS